MRVNLCSEGFERGADGAWLTSWLAPPAVGPAGIRTADLQVCGWMHYHSTAVCSDEWLSLVLVAEFATEKPQTVCFCLPACLSIELSD